VLAKNAPSADQGGLAAGVRKQLQPSRSACISGEAITLPRTGRASCFRIRVARRSSADRKLLAVGLAQTPTDIATRLSLSTA
jgi:hypothetical protein